MPVFKRKYESGKTVWRYLFSGPGATREDRRLFAEVGFASKQDAIDAEAKRRTEELQKFELAKAGAASVAVQRFPTTLGTLFREFFLQHAEERNPRAQDDRALSGTGNSYLFAARGVAGDAFGRKFTLFISAANGPGC